MKTMELPLGVAVVGLGVGEQHAKTFQNLPNCELIWICDIDQEKAEKVALQFPQVKIADQYDQIIQDPNVAIVTIASYDDVHFEQTVSALRAGKHVFVEKPLCCTIDELRQIKVAWSQHHGKIKLTSNHILRAAPLYRWLKKMIVTGELGDLYAIEGDYLYGRIHKITQGWRKDVENYSVMLGGGVHMVDLMIWLTGQKPISAMAHGNRICTQNTDFAYNDYVTAIFRFDNTMIGRITSNFGCVHAHHHILRIFGTAATFIYDDMGPRWHKSRDPEKRSEAIKLSPLPASKGDLIPAFIDAILKDVDGCTHTQEIFDVINTCLVSEVALSSGCEEKIKGI